MKWATGSQRLGLVSILWLKIPFRSHQPKSLAAGGEVTGIFGFQQHLESRKEEALAMVESKKEDSPRGWRRNKQSFRRAVWSASQISVEFIKMKVLTFPFNLTARRVFVERFQGE